MMLIGPFGVRLPQFNHRVWNRYAVFVEHTHC